MGKKYDAYVKAEKAAQAANNRVSDVQGGSTKQAMNEALTNQEQAQRVVNDAWDQFLQDPQG